MVRRSFSGYLNILSNLCNVLMKIPQRRIPVVAEDRPEFADLHGHCPYFTVPIYTQPVHWPARQISRS